MQNLFRKQQRACFKCRNVTITDHLKQLKSKTKAFFEKRVHFLFFGCRNGSKNGQQILKFFLHEKTIFLRPGLACKDV